MAEEERIRWANIFHSGLLSFFWDRWDEGVAEAGVTFSRVEAVLEVEAEVALGASVVAVSEVEAPVEAGRNKLRNCKIAKKRNYL
jgi:hypothetical protein